MTFSYYSKLKIAKENAKTQRDNTRLDRGRRAVHSKTLERLIELDISKTLAFFVLIT
jgi:hypothetical protein